MVIIDYKYICWYDQCPEGIVKQNILWIPEFGSFNSTLWNLRSATDQKMKVLSFTSYAFIDKVFCVNEFSVL